MDKQDLIAAEAADWFVNLQDAEPDAAVRAAFAEWLRQSPAHVAEFLAIAETWGSGRAATESYGSVRELLLAAQTDHANVVPFGNHAGATSPPRRRKWAEPLGYAAAALLAIAIFWFTDSDSRSRHYQTGPGQQLTVSLEDGSVVHLNADSDVRIELDNRQRHIDLRQGEGRFRVAKDARRPFVVSAGRASVRALGTVFDVYRHAAAMRVAVVEGKVEVRTAANEDMPAASSELEAGEEVAVLHSGKFARRRASHPQGMLVWTPHRLTFRSQRLIDVIDEFNRYNAPRMRIEDPALAALEISGAFQADDPQSLLSYLQRHESVDVRRRGDDVIVLRRRN